MTLAEHEVAEHASASAANPCKPRRCPGSAPRRRRNGSSPMRWPPAGSPACSATTSRRRDGIYAVYLTDRLLALRVRVFVDHIVRDIIPPMPP